MKCDASLDELEKAAQAPKKTEVELQKDVVRHHWKSFTIRDAFWHVRDAWKEVMESCICGARKKLCPELAIDLGGLRPVREAFGGAPQVGEELARKVGLDEIEEEDVDSLLETIGEELPTEEHNELRSSGISWRRRWRLSSILRRHRQ